MVRTCTCTHARKHANTAKPPSVSPAHVHILIHTRDASAPQQLSGPSCPSREKNRKHPHGIDLTFGCETRVRAWARTLSKMTSFGKFSCITANLTHEHERTGSFIWVMGCRLRLAVPFCVFNTCDRKANMCNVLQPRTIRLPIDLSWPRPKTNKLWHLDV